jgi:colanic acid biosynthesis glycosyl transferase WcaI
LSELRQGIAQLAADAPQHWYAPNAAQEVSTPSRRVVFVNRYYFPDLSATSQMLTDLAEALACSGTNVEVICCRQLYEDARARLPARQMIRGVTVLRVATTRFGRGRLFGRALDYLSFYITAALKLLRVLRRSDVLVVKTDPPLLSIVGAIVAACRGAHLINWLQDIFPEVASRVAPSPLPRMLEAILCAMRDRSLAVARANVVLGTRMRDYLIARGLAPGRIRISENWADPATISPLPAAQSALRRELGLEDCFVVAYSGNLGRAHDIDTLLRAGELLATDANIAFLMIGGGVNMRMLANQVRARGLGNFRFLPYQPRGRLRDSLSAADVHLVSLLPCLEGLIVPSKLYGILAAGRPVVFIGDPDGELPRIIRDAGVGVSIATGDAVGLCAALGGLREDPAARQQMCLRARNLFEERYTLDGAVARWREILAAAGADTAARRVPH